MSARLNCPSAFNVNGGSLAMQNGCDGVSLYVTSAILHSTARYSVVVNQPLVNNDRR